VNGKLFVILLLLTFAALGGLEFWLIRGLAPAA
jgi:hypothetical protein